MGEPRKDLKSWALVAFLVATALPARATTPEGQDVSLVVATSYVIDSKVLEEQRSVLVTLPDGYDEAGRRYPLLIVLDGSPAMAVHASMSLLDRGIPPFVIVSVPNVDRLRDLSHRNLGDIWPTSGGAARFLAFLTDELVPWLEARFRTTGYRVVTGGSAAGRFAIFALLSAPDVFDAAVARSPMLGTEYSLISDLAKKAFASPPRREHALAIVYGSHDLPGVTVYAERFLRLLEQEAPSWLAFSCDVMDSKGHSQFAGLNVGLTALFANVGFPAERLLDAGPTAVTDDARASAAWIAKGIPQDAVTGERAVIDAACNLSRQRRFADAIRVLSYGLERHPTSVALVYYRAQMLEHAGLTEEAVAAYRKVIEMGPSKGLAGMTTLFLDNLLTEVRPAGG